MTTKILTIAAIILFLASCAVAVGYDQTPTDETSHNEVEWDEIRWIRTPAVFVSDKWFILFEERNILIPPIDDSWDFLGTVHTVLPPYEFPTENFQTNRELLDGRIYHNSTARISILRDNWDDLLNKEVFGDSIIVVLDGRRIMFISEAASAAVADARQANRRSIYVDGERYILSGSGGHPMRDYVFIGEIESYTSRTEYPTQHMQANRENLVGNRVYRLPDGEIIVIHNVIVQLRFFRAMP